MGLGPPTCKKCMCLMGGGYPQSGPYWKCDECGIDCQHKDSGHLFQHTDAELDIILADAPKMRESLERLKELNRKSTAEAIARVKKRREEDK